MSREDSVYLAKLAEQAERYEGQHPLDLPRIPRQLRTRLVPCVAVSVADFAHQKWSRT